MTKKEEKKEIETCDGGFVCNSIVEAKLFLEGRRAGLGVNEAYERAACTCKEHGDEHPTHRLFRQAREAGWLPKGERGMTKTTEDETPQEEKKGTD